MHVEVTYVEESREVGGAFSAYARVDGKLIDFVINGDYDYAIGVRDEQLGLVTPGEGLRNFTKADERHEIVTEVLKQAHRWMLLQRIEQLHVEIELMDVLLI
jgi:hypothetical protein